MEAVTILILIVLVATFVIILIIKGSISSEFKKMTTQVDDVRRRLHTVNNRLINIENQIEKSDDLYKKPDSKKEIVKEHEKEPVKEIIKEPEIVPEREAVKENNQLHQDLPNENINNEIPEKLVGEINPVNETKEVISINEVIEGTDSNRYASGQGVRTGNEYHNARINKEKYSQIQKEKNQNNFEKFIGENLLVKVAVSILVLGMIFLIKWAIDNNWIGEAARIGIGLASGGLLVGLAHASRKKYVAFASVLSGGGLAMLYASISLGFQLYALFSQNVAFILLIIITIFSVILSLGYNRKELAVFAIVGGFASPLLISNGGGNYIALFTYIIILDLGMLVLAYFKKWHIVNVFALFLTFILFGSWLGSSWYDENMPAINAFYFGTGFYLIFFAMFMVQNVIAKHKFTIFDFSLLLTSTFLYYIAGMFIIHRVNPDYEGIFTASIAVFNFAIAFPLYKRGDIDKKFIFLLIGVVLTFLSLTAPVQLDGQYITIFWAIESVVLLWLSGKTDYKLLRVFSGIVVVLAAGSLFMDWNKIYINSDAPHMPPFLNKGFITSISVVISLVLNSIILRKDEQLNILHNMKPQGFRVFISLLILIFMYFSLSLELSYQFKFYFELEMLQIVLMACFHFTYLLGMLIWAFRAKINILSIVLISVSYLSIFVYMTVLNLSYDELLSDFLSKDVQYSFINYRLATTILVSIIAYLIWYALTKMLGRKHSISRISLWLTTGIVVFVLSADISNLVLLANAEEFTKLGPDDYMVFDTARSQILESAHRIAWPILWGTGSFILIIMGLKMDMRDFRIIALALFFVTIAKLFAWDVWYMSQGGRVMAFISLGVLLLIVSFVYQKLKTFLFEKDEDENKEIIE